MTQPMLELDQIYHMDCLQGMDLLPERSVDMVLCDLPYGTTHCKWDAIIPFDALWKHYRRIVKDNGAIVLFSGQPFTSALVNSNLPMFRYEWIWHKPHPTGFLNAKRMPLKAHENILVFYRRLPTYHPQMTHGHVRKVAHSKYRSVGNGESIYGKEVRDTMYDSTDRYPLDVQIFSSGDQTKKFHPTEKPVALCEYLIKTYSNPGEVVLDNCIGSGTTAVASLRCGRHFVGFETELQYVLKARERINLEKRKGML